MCENKPYIDLILKGNRNNFSLTDFKKWILF